MSLEAIYPGSFDPITNGHIDIIKRALKIFDKIHVGVIQNFNKQPLFTLDERVDMIQQSISSNKVSIEGFNGLLVDYARQKNVFKIVRGLRAVSDFDYEFQMSLTNRELEKKLDTIFLMTDQKYSYLSSNIVRQLAKMNHDASSFVSPYVEAKLLEKCHG